MYAERHIHQTAISVALRLYFIIVLATYSYEEHVVSSRAIYQNHHQIPQPLPSKTTLIFQTQNEYESKAMTKDRAPTIVRYIGAFGSGVPETPHGRYASYGVE
jgi:hypothetical protein